MNDRIADLLDEASDDAGRPLGFTTRDVVARGRTARGRRTALAAGVPLVAAAAAVVAIAVATSGGSADVVPPAGRETGTDPATAPATPAPTSSGYVGENTPMTAQDAQVMSECLGLAPGLQGWRFDAQVTDEAGTTATFVSDDHTRWRVCTLGEGGPTRPGVGPAWPLDTSPVTDDIVYDSGIEYADQCPKDGAPSCSRILYTVALPLREGVATVDVETPLGSDVAAVTGVVTYVVRFTEARVDDPLPPVLATLRDADGDVVRTYDYNELMR